ncbi:MAG: ATP-binding cassette domain-containing protein [Gammaproteobacteria bacterium]|nr:ATP-binding cassette domain-containing protein [Gammaproteobacteria bacterium]
MLEAKNITLIRQGKYLLDDISVSIQPGKVTGIIGPNGAGKSSLLKVLSGCLKADKGEVNLHKQTLLSWSAIKRSQHCGFLSQKPTVSAEFSVAEIVTLGRYPYRHLSRNENRAVVERYLELLNLTDFSHRAYSTLSGGEQQRVHLARLLAQLDNAILPENKLLLLDEHMAHLDWAYQNWTFAYLRKIAAQGIGVVLVSHDMDRLKQYADEVIILSQAKLYTAGAVSEILSEKVLSEVFGLKIDAGRYC